MQTPINTDTTGLRVLWDDVKKCYCFEDAHDCGRLLPFTITMQNGDSKVNGHTGPTIEALLAIAEHRVDTYNQGEWKCEENDSALRHLKHAAQCLFRRWKRLYQI